MREGRLKRTGLVATNSMRGGANRRVLDVIVKEGTIFNAWDDEKWVVKGAAVRVSMVCFAAEADAAPQTPRLDGRTVERIGSDLSGLSLDLTTARPLAEQYPLAKKLDAALTDVMRSAFAAVRAEIGPHGYDDRIFKRKAMATSAVHALNAEAERLLTLRETHRLTGIPPLPGGVGLSPEVAGSHGSR